MLFTGRVRIEREERFSLKQGEETTLVVEPVRKEDAGRYPDSVVFHKYKNDDRENRRF